MLIARLAISSRDNRLRRLLMGFLFYVRHPRATADAYSNVSDIYEPVLIKRLVIYASSVAFEVKIPREI